MDFSLSVQTKVCTFFMRCCTNILGFVDVLEFHLADVETTGVLPAAGGCVEYWVRQNEFGGRDKMFVSSSTHAMTIYKFIFGILSSWLAVLFCSPCYVATCLSRIPKPIPCTKRLSVANTE